MWLFLASEVMLFGALFSAYVLLRVGAPEGSWPVGTTETHLSVPIGTLNTMILIISSVTMVLAWAALKMNNFAKARNCMLATVALASLFLFIKLTFEYAPKLHHYAVWLDDGAHLTGHIESEADDHIMFIEDEHHGDHAETEATHEPTPQRIERASIKRLSNYGPQMNTYFATYWTITGLHGLHVLGGIIVIGYLALPGARLWKTNPDQFANRVECTGLYWHFVDLVWIFVFPILYLL
jgi:cytochrome c oxidase subunit 3